MTIYLRSLAAVCAAFLATVICIVERHVVVVLSQPATYANPLHHKCGLLLTGCAGWAFVELAGLTRVAARTSG